MLTHYILTAGQHPYGDNAFDIEVNIAGGWLKMKEINNEANHLLWLMMSKEPRDRPDIHNVLRSVTQSIFYMYDMLKSSVYHLVTGSVQAVSTNDDLAMDLTYCLNL